MKSHRSVFTRDNFPLGLSKGVYLRTEFGRAVRFKFMGGPLNSGRPSPHYTLALPRGYIIPCRCPQFYIPEISRTVTASHFLRRRIDSPRKKKQPKNPVLGGHPRPLCFGGPQVKERRTYFEWRSLFRADPLTFNTPI